MYSDRCLRRSIHRKALTWFIVFCSDNYCQQLSWTLILFTRHEFVLEKTMCSICALHNYDRTCHCSYILYDCDLYWYYIWFCNYMYTQLYPELLLNRYFKLNKYLKLNISMSATYQNEFPLLIIPSRRSNGIIN